MIMLYCVYYIGSQSFLINTALILDGLLLLVMVLPILSIRDYYVIGKTTFTPSHYSGMSL